MQMQVIPSPIMDSNIGNQKITKSPGQNKSEEYLAKLCDKTFLSLWSYPNLYRAKGKELSDLLVVFGNNILIFSDKTCEYPTTDNPELNWSRWFRRAVAKSAKQLWRAEQWIKQHPHRVFLDKECSQEFPFDIDTTKAKVHLILVARGVAEACKEFFGSGSGSLMVRNDVKGIDAHFAPFVIGDINCNNLALLRSQGASRVAVCRAILRKHNPFLAARYFAEALKD